MMTHSERMVVRRLDAADTAPLESVKNPVKRQISSLRRWFFRNFLQRILKQTMKMNRIAGLAIAAVGALILAPGASLAQGDAAKANVSQCAGCHEIAGYKASYPTVYSVPKLYGQTAKYIETALIAYRKGDRAHPTMRGIAGSLSDQDISNLAAYYGSK